MEYKLTTLGRIVVISWFINAAILVTAWWGGYYLVEEMNQKWMNVPLNALLVTHSIIKIVLTVWTIGAIISREDNFINKVDTSASLDHILRDLKSAVSDLKVRYTSLPAVDDEWRDEQKDAYAKGFTEALERAEYQIWSARKRL